MLKVAAVDGKPRQYAIILLHDQKNTVGEFIVLQELDADRFVAAER